MKVFLLADVPGIGQRGQVIEVKDGYGRNFLILKGLARIATEALVREAAQQKNIHDAHHQSREAELSAALARLAEHALEFKKKANEKGHLFDAVDAKDILPLLEHHGLKNIKKDHIEGVPLKSIGEHTVRVTVGGRTAEVKIRVLRV